ncbi:MAG: hypothetical protein ACI88A_001606 [Paraglaciecola sp.]|jgi:hypothetical protein
MNLRTKTILLCTLVGLTFSATSFANTEITAANTDIELNLTLEIEQNLQTMMAEMQGPSINQEAVKQLKHGFLEQHTNQLVKNARNELPEYKFKVILTD